MSRSLEARFRLTVFAVILLPVMALTGSVYLWMAGSKAEERPYVGLRSVALRGDASKLTEVAAILAEAIDRFMIDRIGEARAWASSPVVVNAVNRLRDAHAKQGLDALSTQQVEEKFRIEKTLGLAPDAEAYLREQLKSSPHFAEVFFTDGRGYNVALTNPTSDFVQSDEEWWQRAWSSGFSVGEIEFDESAGVWGLDLSVRIQDPGTGASIGVLKAVVSIRFVQAFADRLALRLSAPGQLLHAQLAAARTRGDSRSADPAETGVHLLVGSADGQLIAETRSRHARGRIMQPELNLLSGESLGHFNQGYGGERSGAFIANRDGPEGDSEKPSHLVAFARSGGSDVYAPVAANFPGFDWIVLVDAPNLSGFSVLPGVPETPDQAGRLSGVLWLAAATCLSLFLASVLLCWLFGKWVLAPVRMLTDRVRNLGQGQIGGKITAPSNDEFADLASALDQVRQVISRMANRLQRN